MNGLNVIVFGLNLCGLETKVPCCNANVVCFLTTAEIGMLIFMQITYFTAQDNSCMVNSPDLYFWLMFLILIQYVGLAVILCYFLRKLDVDDSDDYTPIAEVQDEEK